MHAAGQALPTLFGRDPVGTYAPNVLGTHYLLERAARDRASGVLFLSSGAVQGTLAPDVERVREDVYGVVDPLDGGRATPSRTEGELSEAGSSSTVYR